MLGDLEAVGIRPHEGRVLGIALQHIIRQQIDVHAGLHDVLAAAVEPGIRQIIADREPALLEILDRIVAADPRRKTAEELRDGARVVGVVLIAIALISDCELVEQRAAEDGILGAARPRIHVQQRRKLPRVIGDTEESSEFTQVAVMTIIDRQLQRRRGTRFVAQLAEKERFPERSVEAPVERREIECVENWKCARGRNVDGYLTRPLLVIPFVRREQVQAIADERPAHRQAELAATIVVVEGGRLPRRRRDTVGDPFVAPLERIQCHDCVVLESEEGVAFPGIAARAGRGDDDAARRLLVLGLVVLGEDAEFLNRVARKDVAAAPVLTHDSAACEVVLVARAVDEDVDLVGALGARRAHNEGAARAADLIVLRDDAGRECGEIENVAVGGGEVLELLLRDVGRNLGRSRFDHRRGFYRYCLQLEGPLLQSEVNE